MEQFFMLQMPSTMLEKTFLDINFNLYSPTSLHPPDSKNLLNDPIKSSLQGYTGSGDVLVNGKMNTIAYQPVLVNGKKFCNLVTLAPNTILQAM